MSVFDKCLIDIIKRESERSVGEVQIIVPHLHPNAAKQYSNLSVTYSTTGQRDLEIRALRPNNKSFDDMCSSCIVLALQAFNLYFAEHRKEFNIN